MTVSQWLPQMLFVIMSVVTLLNAGDSNMTDKQRGLAFWRVVILNALLWWGGFYSAFSG